MITRSRFPYLFLSPYILVLNAIAYRTRMGVGARYAWINSNLNPAYALLVTPTGVSE